MDEREASGGYQERTATGRAGSKGRRSHGRSQASRRRRAEAAGRGQFRGGCRPKDGGARLGGRSGDPRAQHS